MEGIERNITGYIWFNPDAGLYQKGQLSEFKQLVNGSSDKLGYSLILELNEQSELYSGKLLRELNSAKEQYESTQLRVAV